VACFLQICGKWSFTVLYTGLFGLSFNACDQLTEEYILDILFEDIQKKL